MYGRFVDAFQRPILPCSYCVHHRYPFDIVPIKPQTAKNNGKDIPSSAENSKNSKEVSNSSGNFTTYSLTDNGYYIYLCKVDDTLLYTRVKEEYKEEVDKFIQELGY